MPPHLVCLLLWETVGCCTERFRPGTWTWAPASHLTCLVPQPKLLTRHINLLHSKSASFPPSREVSGMHGGCLAGPEQSSESASGVEKKYHLGRGFDLQSRKGTQKKCLRKIYFCRALFKALLMGPAGHLDKPSPSWVQSKAISGKNIKSFLRNWTQGGIKPEPQVGQGRRVVSKPQAQEGLSRTNPHPPYSPTQHLLILQLEGSPFKDMGTLSMQRSWPRLLSLTTASFSSQQPQENLSDAHFAISPKK